MNSKGDILLTRHIMGTWSFPKGHVEPNEDIKETAIREIYEESGVTDLELIKEFDSYQRKSLDKIPEWKTISLFLFRTDQQEIGPMDSSIAEVRWVRRDDVTELLTHEKDREFFEEIRSSLWL